jgi:hypothetical protein
MDGKVGALRTFWTLLLGPVVIIHSTLFILTKSYSHTLII